MFVPGLRKIAIGIIGNSISAPHAAIALLNALAFVTNLTPVEIAETFAQLIDSRLKASVLSVHDVEGGFALSNSENAATVPMHLCEVLVMKSPVDESEIHVQVGLNILDILRVLMGASTPAHVYLVPGGILEHKVPLLPKVLMRLEKTTLFASVQACLLMPTLMFGRSEGDSKFVIALCTFGPVVIARKANMCVGDVINFLKLEFEQRPLFGCDTLGFCLDVGDPCPDAVVVLSVPGIVAVDFSGLLRLDLSSQGMHTTFQGFSIDLAPVTRLLHVTGIHDLLMCLGWSMGR